MLLFFNACTFFFKFHRIISNSLLPSIAKKKDENKNTNKEKNDYVDTNDQLSNIKNAYNISYQQSYQKLRKNIANTSKFTNFQNKELTNIVRPSIPNFVEKNYITIYKKYEKLKKFCKTREN